MSVWTAVLAMLATAQLGPGDTVAHIDAKRVVHHVSPYLYGACIEDVNHEIYGGLYSQMVFGESFQEPPRAAPIEGFTAFGGRWAARDGVLDAEAGDGPKLVAEGPVVTTGEVSVELFFAEDRGGNAGMVVKVDGPGLGADAFTGYEVSVESRGRAVLGRHRRNWEPIRTVDCEVPVGRWMRLTAVLGERRVEVKVDGRSVITFEDAEHPLPPGRVGLRTWRRPARFRNLSVVSEGSTRPLPFQARPRTPDDGLSGMWSAFAQGTARGDCSIGTDAPFLGRQSQKLTFESGQGAVGIVNFGLNRWGMNLVAGRPYEGHLWARAPGVARLTVGFQGRDGRARSTKAGLEVVGPRWSRLDFSVTPDVSDASGGLAVALEAPGQVDLGYVFLQPGEWGRFQGLPVRKDVAEGLVDQHLTVLRYGGSMVNHPEYRWRSMIGPRDRRPPHQGTWYPYSSNGWGIFDFLDFCEAAGFLAIPTVNMDETPRDMAAFVEYVNGPPDSPWGRRRAADGHPRPYGLRHLELGNEEAVDEAYWSRFQPLAEAIWAKDPGMVLVVGDFTYGQPIEDPYDFQGGAAVKSLAAHRKILELARKRDREVWFDVHVWTEQPPQPNGLRPERSYIQHLEKLVPGAPFKVAILEFNANDHAMRRALSNACAINEVERIGNRLSVACSANGLQPDGQNDNGWDQGLLFLNPERVWLQPPGHVTRMAARAYQPLLVETRLVGPSEGLSLNAKRSEDGKTLVLQVVNWAREARRVTFDLAGFVPSRTEAEVEELAAPEDAVNTAASPDRVAPRTRRWTHGSSRGPAAWTFPPGSFTVIRIE